MQTTSSTWQELYSQDNAVLETKAIIGNTEYTEITPPIITRALTQNGVSLGNVVSAVCTFTVQTEDIIPKSSQVQIKMRLVGGTEDVPIESEWLSAGTFYVSRRTESPIEGLVDLECYDSLLKANAVWEPASDVWPKSDTSVVSEIATLLGVQVDNRTVLSGSSIVTKPEVGTAIRDILGMIGAYNGGNWILSPQNKLRLVPLVSADDADDAESDVVDVQAVVGSMTKGKEYEITGIRCTVDSSIFLVGTDDGIVVETTIAPVAAATLIETIGGMKHRPFALTTAYYDPAAELGDFVRYDEDISSVLYAETVELGVACTGDISSPDPAELADEYPYIGARMQEMQVLHAEINQLNESAITGVDVEYNQTNDPNTPPDEDDPNWDTDPPAYQEGYYIWQRTATTTISGTTYSDPVCITGHDGINTATITLYKRNASQPSAPSVEAGYTTYTFSSKTLSPVPSGWSTSVPSGDDPCWVSAVTAASNTATDRIDNNEWTTPVMMSDNGADGLNQATIMLYQRAASQPSAPSISTTYTFATGALSAIPTGWSRSIPNGTDPCYVTSAAAISSSPTYTIPSSAWAGVTKMVEDGASAKVYELLCSPSALVRDDGGTLQPTSIAFSATQAIGNGTPSAYSGRFVIEEYDGSSWTTKYTSSSDESSKNYSPTSTATVVRTALYLAGGTTSTLDTQSVPIVSDGSEGGSGADAYTVMLSNESHTFAAGTSAAVLGGAAVSQIISYKGRTPIAAHIGTITGTGIDKFTVSINGNDTTSAYFTLTVNASDLTQQQGVFTVPVTVDGQTFSLKFSWTLALTGQTGRGTSQIQEQYMIALNSYTPTGNEEEGTGYTKWSTSQPEWESGYSIWTRSKITWTDGTTTYTSPVLAQAINGANQSAANANAAVTSLDNRLTQQEIYDRLTNHSANQGIILLNGQLYINASYINSGIINGDYVQAQELNILGSDGTTVIASLKDTITLGSTDNAHAMLDFNSFELYDNNGNEFFSAGNIQATSTSITTIMETFIGTGRTKKFIVHSTVYSVTSVTVDGSTATYTRSGKTFTISTMPAASATIIITYTTNSPVYHYDLGTRASGSSIGPFSYVEGTGNTSSGIDTHAEGDATSAIGSYSHTEGYSTTTNGPYSHAEGYGSTTNAAFTHVEGYKTTAGGSASGSGGFGAHAEGYETVASGDYSHAEGYDAQASGTASHAEGAYTRASSDDQHVFGVCNIEDTSNQYIEIVGNGSRNARSNARTLDWNGNETIAGTLTAQGLSLTSALPVSAGGTGRTTLTSGSALVGNGTGNVSLRSIVNNTSATAVTASTSLVTANTLYYHKGNSNIVTVGTITSGTWHGTAIAADYGGTGATSLRAARQNFFPTNHSSSGADYLISITSNWEGGGYIQLPLPIAYGGTGQSTRVGATDALLSLGNNPVSTTANDTRTNWINLGSGFAYYNSSVLHGQPAQYGILISYVYVDIIEQEFWPMGTNTVYRRNANASATTMPDFVIANGQAMQSGFVETTGAVSANSYKDYSVTFSPAFSAAPNVVVGFSNSTTAGGFGNCSCGVASVTTTGCTLRIWNADSSNRSPSLYWIAMA